MEFFQTLFEWYMANLNYFTIALLMAIESTFLPLPSEVVIPFAAYKAGQGDLNVFFVVIWDHRGSFRFTDQLYTCILSWSSACL